MKAIILLFLLSLWTPVFSKSPNVIVSDVHLITQAEYLTGSFSVWSSRKGLSSNYKLRLFPTIAGADSSLTMDPIVIETRRTRIIDSRRQSAPAEPNKNYILRGENLSYNVRIPYKQWFDGAQLIINQSIEGCCTERALPPITNLTSISAPKPAAKPTQHRRDTIKQLTIKQVEFKQGDLKVDFRVGNTVIDPTLLNNRKTLEEIKTEIESIINDPSKRLRQIEIIGYASPEGNTQHNTILAAQRAAELKNYIQQIFTNIPDNSFKIINGGENWDGLRQEVSKSNIESKERILYIIDNVYQIGRKAELQSLGGGAVYAQLLRTVFPQLRNAIYVSIKYQTESKSTITLN